MHRIKSLFAPKKVKMSDVASPKPTKAASRAVDSAMRRAYQDQASISTKASTMRTH